MRALGIMTLVRRQPQSETVLQKLLAGPPTAVLRAACRNPSLLPADASPEAFERWCEMHDAAPDDRAELYADVCELAGWDTITPEPEQPSLHPALSPDEAARRFVAWVRLQGKQGFYLNDELNSLYSEHAAAIGHEETPAKSVRSALAELGIPRRQITAGKRQTNAREKRVRPVQWDLRLFNGLARIAA